MVTHNPPIDLRGKIPPIRSKHGTFSFLRAESWREASRFMLIRVAKNGVEATQGVRLDIDKRAILDDLGNAKDMSAVNRSLRTVRARQIWNVIARELRAGQG